MNYTNIFKDDLLEIYSNDDYNKLDVGYIIFEDEKNILFQLIHPMGFVDGKTLILKEKISKIQSNTDYLKEIKILMEENSKENILNSYIFSNKKEISYDIDNFFDSILTEIMNKNMICSLIMSDENKCFGYIVDFNKDFITLNYNNEITVVKRKEIYEVAFDNITQKRDAVVDNRK